MSAESNREEWVEQNDIPFDGKDYKIMLYNKDAKDFFDRMTPYERNKLVSRYLSALSNRTNPTINFVSYLRIREIVRDELNKLRETLINDIKEMNKCQEKM